MTCTRGAIVLIATMFLTSCAPPAEDTVSRSCTLTTEQEMQFSAVLDELGLPPGVATPLCPGDDQFVHTQIVLDLADSRLYYARGTWGSSGGLSEQQRIVITRDPDVLARVRPALCAGIETWELRGSAARDRAGRPLCGGFHVDLSEDDRGRCLDGRYEETIEGYHGLGVLVRRESCRQTASPANISAVLPAARTLLDESTA